MPVQPPAFLEDAFTGPVRLAVFGKHPAAADHLEDIGLSTASLVAFKQGFYIDGIGGSLARQTWHKELPAADDIPYDHELLCVGPAGWLAARFMHSSDASGRKQYPFVVAVHGCDIAILDHAEAMLAELDAFACSLAGLKDAAALREAHARASVEWEAGISRWRSDPIAVRPAKEAWLRVESLGSAPSYTGLGRIAHALLPEGAGAGRARVPLAQPDAALARSLWLSFAQLLLQYEVPVITILGRHGDLHADLVTAPPGARALVSVFAPLTAQPLTSDVPFAVSDDITSMVQEAAAVWLQEPALFWQPDTAGNGSNTLIQRICSGFRSWLKSSR